MKLKSPQFLYWGTASYIIMITMINYAFSILPIYQVWGCDVSPMDPIAGIIYLSRDFAQRELGHYIFIPMIIGGVLSYSLASPVIAVASISAFIVGELIDWSIFTFSKRPLSDRLLWSALISSPFDSAVFLIMINRFNLLAVVLTTISKLLGAWLIWFIWLRRQKKKALVYC